MHCISATHVTSFHTHTHNSEDMACNSKWKTLNRKNTAELIIYTDSDNDVYYYDKSDSDMSNTDIHDKE
jgi:hypothetical protein